MFLFKTGHSVLYGNLGDVYFLLSACLPAS